MTEPGSTIYPMLVALITATENKTMAEAEAKVIALRAMLRAPQ